MARGMSLIEILDERQRLLAVADEALRAGVRAENVVGEIYKRWYALDAVERAQLADPMRWLLRVADQVCLETSGATGAARRPPAVGRPRGSPPLVAAGRVLRFDQSAAVVAPDALVHLLPSVRAAYLLHDVAGLSVGTIARALEMTYADVHRHISTVHRRIGWRGRTNFHPQRAVVRAFALACRFDDGLELAVLLDPVATAIVDGGGAVRIGTSQAHGRREVLRLVCTLFARQEVMSLVERDLNGRPGLLAVRGHEVVAVIAMTVSRMCIRDVLMVLNPHKLRYWNN